MKPVYAPLRFAQRSRRVCTIYFVSGRSRVRRLEMHPRQSSCERCMALEVAKSAHIRPKFEEMVTSCRFGPNLFTRRSVFIVSDDFWGYVDRRWSNLGQMLPTSAEVWPRPSNLGRFQADWLHVAHIGQMCCHTANFCRLRSDSRLPWQLDDNLWTTCGQPLVNFWTTSKLAGIAGGFRGACRTVLDNFCAKFGLLGDAAIIVGPARERCASGSASGTLAGARAAT